MSVFTLLFTVSVHMYAYFPIDFLSVLPPTAFQSFPTTFSNNKKLIIIIKNKYKLRLV